MLDTVTFFSIWYWALAIALWSEIGASAYGVTGRLMRDAAKGDAEAAELVDRLARRSAARIAEGWEKRGALQVGGASALIAGLATLAFGAGSEAALGLLLIVGPTAGLTALATHEAILVHRHQPAPQILLEVATARRRANLSAGMFSLAGSIFVAVLLNAQKFGMPALH